jgi:hypothetical protein
VEDNVTSLPYLRDGYCAVTKRPRSGLLGRYRHVKRMWDMSSDRDRWVIGVMLMMDERGLWE